MPTYYTQIAVGAAANADTINDPMDQLDAAIVAARTASSAAIAAEASSRAAAIAAEGAIRAAADNALDDRIDNVVGYSGTSTVEVVDARTAGNTGSAAASLTQRLEWLEGANNVHAAAYGFADGNTAAANSTALTAAMNAATALGAPSVVILPAGHFSLNNITLNTGIVLRGARMPVYDFVSAMHGGTILEGALLTLAHRSGVMDIGIIVADKNAISGGGVNDCLVLNVCALGDGTNHGCVFAPGHRNVVMNFSAAEFAHGLVFKGQHNQATMIRTFNCSISCLTLKSDAGVDCYGNLISNLWAEGAGAGNGGGIWLHALASHSVYGNSITNFYINNAGYGVYASADHANGYECVYNRVSNGIIRNTIFGGVQLDAAGDIALNGPNYNDFANITVNNAGGYGFTNQYGGTGNALHGCREHLCAGHVFGAWRKYDAGFGNLSSMILRLAKTSATTVVTGVAGWTDIPWETESDANAMHVASSAEIGLPPVSGAVYRIRAAVVFAANATGLRRVALQRSIAGGPYSEVIGTVVSPGSAGDMCQVMLEYVSQFNSSYLFKVSVQQTSGVDLTVTTASHLTVELME